MESNSPLDQRVNPKSTIWLPLGVVIGLVVITIFIYLYTYITGGEISKWASAFTVLVTITLVLTGMVTFAIVAFGIGGMKELSGRMPEWLMKVQAFSTIGNVNGKRISNGITRPVILIRQGIAGVKSTFTRK